MTITFKYDQPPTDLQQTEARAIADQLKIRLAPLENAIEEAEAWLTVFYMQDDVCRVIINAPRSLLHEIWELVGPAEEWT